MNRFAKMITCGMASVALACGLAACGSASNTGGSASAASTASTASTSQTADVRVASLKGPTSIGLVDFMDQKNNATEGTSYTFTVAGAADEIMPQLIQGNIDIALVPANVASVLYNRTSGGVQVVDINTLGVLWVVTGDDSINSISDLAGHTVYMTGKGATPEYLMNYLLNQAGITDQVTMEYKSEATEVASELASNPSAIAVLPEPYVTSVCNRVSGLEPRISLTDAWSSTEAGENGSQLVTGVTVVRTEFLKQHPDLVSEFVQGQQESVEQVKADPAAAAQLVVNLGIIDNAKIAEQAIPRCNLTCITGQEMQDTLAGYYQVLYDADPASVGGTLPDDGFYCLNAL